MTPRPSQTLFRLSFFTLFISSLCLFFASSAHAASYHFINTLKLGSSNDEVRQLQALLNNDPTTAVAKSGVGSKGKETAYFGPATFSAVVKFQNKYKSEVLTPAGLTKGTGFVGTLTLKKLNSLSSSPQVTTSACLPGVAFNIHTGKPCTITPTSTTTAGVTTITSCPTNYTYNTTTHLCDLTETGGGGGGGGGGGSPPPVTPPTVTANTCSSITQYGITWTFDKSYSCGQFVNGDWWVVGPITLTSITPTATLGRNGWEINPQSHTYQPYDSRADYYNATLQPTLPALIQATSSIIKTISVITPASTGDQSDLQTAAVLTVVSSPPPGNGALVFRPPYFGTDKLYYYASSMDLSVLPSLAPVANTPSLDWLTQRFQKVQIDHQQGQAGRSIHPIDNMPDYGAQIAEDNADATLRLMLNDPQSAKQSAALGYVQMGIDLYQMLVKGQAWTADGGHQLGRKLAILFDGIVFHNQAMKDAVTDAPSTTFQEDSQITYFPNGNNGNGMTLWGQTNSELTYWTELANPGTGTKSALDPYGYIDGGSAPGQLYQQIVSLPFKAEALAVRLLPNGISLWNNAHFFDYADRWVTVGTWTQPDPCAPYDGNWSDYGGTFGPDGHGSCIKDTNPSDGVGRFPTIQGINKNAGSYGSTFAGNMWTAYRGSIPPVETSCVAPSITSSLSASATVGSAFSYTVTSSGTAVPSYTATGLPFGLSISNGNISGTPAQAGNYSVALTATNSCGSDTKNLTISVTSAPVGNPPSGLVAYFPFDGNVDDTSGNGNNAIAFGNPTYVAGKSGQALSFDGSTNYVDAGVRPGFNLTTSGSVSLWFNTNDLSDHQWHTLVSTENYNSDRNGYNLQIRGSNHNDLYFEFANGSGAQGAESGNLGEIIPGTWYHAVLTWDGSTVTMYLNGSLSYQTPQTVIPISNVNSLRIAQDPVNVGAFGFFGAIDNVRVYNRALSGSEVFSLYNSGI